MDQLVFVKNFSTYYLACGSSECSYKVLRRNTIIDIFGILLGLYGGLTLALQLIAPQSVRCFTYLQTSVFQNRKRMNQTLQVSTGNRSSMINVHVELSLVVEDDDEHPKVAWNVQILQYWIKIKEMIESQNLFMVTKRILIHFKSSAF